MLLLSGNKLENLAYDLGLGLPVDAIVWKVNGRRVTADRILRDGDQMYLIPAAAL